MPWQQSQKREPRIPLYIQGAPRLNSPPPASSDDDLVARGRARWLRKCLDELDEHPAHAVALGWERTATAELFAHVGIQSLTTVAVGREPGHTSDPRSSDDRTTHVHVSAYRATESADLAVVAGLLGRMPARERSAVAVLMFRSLESGGLFAMWETNPWSPAALLAASPKRGRDVAEGIVPPDARRLLRGVGFDIVNTTSTFFFPRALSWVHLMWPLLAPIPIGPEYMVLARKP